MIFIFNAFDKENSLGLRTQTREQHLQWADNVPDNITLLLGGPRLDDNENMVGSTMVFECDNKQDLENWLQSDPYQQVGLFEKTALEEYKIVKNNF